MTAHSRNFRTKRFALSLAGTSAQFTNFKTTESYLYKYLMEPLNDGKLSIAGLCCTGSNGGGPLHQFTPAVTWSNQ
jgi:hypothetical protein